MQATTVIPIVFALGVDPVGAGVVASLAQPGGNVTGLSTQSADTAGKRLELLRVRHDGRTAGKVVRGVQPGRCRDRAEVRRHWARACHHPQARAHDGRRRDRGKRAGQGFSIYGAAAGQRAQIRRAWPPARMSRGPAAFSTRTPKVAVDEVIACRRSMAAIGTKLPIAALRHHGRY
jgi:ABC transporter substrate binding protein